MRIGVLALQGDFARHAQALARSRSSASRDASSDEASRQFESPSRDASSDEASRQFESPSRDASSDEASRQSPSASRQFEIEVVEVRKPEQLDDVDGLIIPGGESTTLLRLMEDWGFVPALEKFHGAGRPIFGTCAGAIVLAREVEGPRQFSLGFIDITVERNAYGRQRESFVASGQTALEGRPASLEMVFIRAPRIRRLGPGVETLARHGDEPVLTRQGSVLAGTFHPELTDDPAVHRYFCGMVWRSRSADAVPQARAREASP